MLDAKDSPSTRPYLIRALFEWCTDNGFTPYVAVMVDDTVRVPVEYVKDGEIVLNISYDATSALKLGNEYIEFKARFAGVAREIMVPVSRVIAIYARENGQGMAFPVGQTSSSANEAGAQAAKDSARRQEADNVVSLVSVADSGTPKSEAPQSGIPEGDGPQPPAPTGGRPALKRIK
jgi:stringent starvation protein B